MVTTNPVTRDILDMIETLASIELGAQMGFIPGVLTALEARMLKLELADSETALDALARAGEFVQWCKQQTAKVA